MATLSLVSHLFHTVVVTCLQVFHVKQKKKILIQTRVMLSMYHGIYFVCCEDFDQEISHLYPSPSTHQIQGQYVLLHLKWLESGPFACMMVLPHPCTFSSPTASALRSTRGSISYGTKGVPPVETRPFHAAMSLAQV